MKSLARCPPFRADHVGSLLRPAPLRRAFRDFQDGCIAAGEFAAIQDAAIREVVRRQEEIGLELVTDGELRRASYWGRFVERTAGFGLKPAGYRFRDDHGEELGFIAPHVTGKVRRTQELAADEVRFLATLTRTAVKVTLPAPSTMHFWRGREYADPGTYSSPEEFFADLGQIYRSEIAACARAGARYVQLDEVALVMLCDEATRECLRADGQDPDELVELYVRAINQAVASRPAGLVIGVHVCRGNFKGRYLAEGSYDSIAERLFQGTAVDHFLLEYDTPRAGDFAPLRFLPRGKGAVLGLVSSKSPRLESPEELQRRIAEASRYVPLEQLGLCPQCGFASTAAGNPVSEETMWAKLALIVECADGIWH